MSRQTVAERTSAGSRIAAHRVPPTAPPPPMITRHVQMAGPERAGAMADLHRFVSERGNRLGAGHDRRRCPASKRESLSSPRLVSTRPDCNPRCAPRHDPNLDRRPEPDSLARRSPTVEDSTGHVGRHVRRPPSAKFLAAPAYCTAATEFEFDDSEASIGIHFPPRHGVERKDHGGVPTPSKKTLCKPHVWISRPKLLRCDRDRARRSRFPRSIRPRPRHATQTRSNSTSRGRRLESPIDRRQSRTVIRRREKSRREPATNATADPSRG